MLFLFCWYSRLKADNPQLGSEGYEGFVRLNSKNCHVERIIMHWDIEYFQLIWINERVIHNRSKPYGLVNNYQILPRRSRVNPNFTDTRHRSPLHRLI